MEKIQPPEKPMSVLKGEDYEALQKAWDTYHTKKKAHPFDEYDGPYWLFSLIPLFGMIGFIVHLAYAGLVFKHYVDEDDILMQVMYFIPVAMIGLLWFI